MQRFREVAAAVPAKRYSLANSAGICLGRDYSFDLVRPGLALYGGIPRREAEGQIRQVAHVEAQIVQRRTIRAGESCGYGATFVADADTEAAILNIGYADGYLRGFSSKGAAFAGEFALPVLGRVSMDLIAVGCDAAPRAQGRRVGRARLRLADGVRGFGAFAVRAADDPRLAVRAALGLVSRLGGVFGL